MYECRSAIYIAGKAKTLEEGVRKAEELIDSKAALKTSGVCRRDKSLNPG